MSHTGQRWYENFSTAECDFDVLHQPTTHPEQYDAALYSGSVKASDQEREHAEAAIAELEAAGIRIINSTATCALVRDKYKTALALETAGLPHPETKLAAEGLPGGKAWIVKPTFGTMGRGVRIFRDREKIEQYVQEQTEDLIVQSYHQGETIRAVASADQLLYCYMKLDPHGGPANVFTGAVRHWLIPDEGLENLATETVQALGGDLFGLDIQRSRDGLRVLEANSNFTIYSEDAEPNRILMNEFLRLAQTPAST